MNKVKTLTGRFSDKYIINQTSQCWEWTGVRRKRPNGELSYGRLVHCGKEYLAHRVAWIIFKGEIPLNLEVCHRCDNPACVNPEHLFVGTHKENMHDCMNKKRHHHGLTHRSRKLDAQKIKEIFKLKEQKISNLEIAKRMGVKAPSIRKVLTGMSWKSLTGEIGMHG